MRQKLSLCLSSELSVLRMHFHAAFIAAANLTYVFLDGLERR